jgi:hypothetical protein
MVAYVLPIVFVSITTFTANTTTLFRSGVITLLALVIYLFKPFDLLKYKFFIIIFSIIFIWYLVSFLVTDQSYVNFLLGAYGRNFGILTLLALFLLMLESAEFYRNEKAKLAFSIYTLLIMANIYGAIQNLGLDPLNWETGAGAALTLGNPNFSSALFGMLSFLPLYYFNLSSGYIKLFHLLVFAATFTQILLSGSSQGFFLFVFNLISLIIIYNKSYIINKKKSIIVIVAFILVPLIFVFINNFSRILNFANSSVQLNARLEHWRLGVKVFYNNWLFGTGIDNLSRYSGEFRNLTNRSWGQYVHPDKSHNVMIDYFATGGVIIGLTWLIFIMTILIYAVKVFQYARIDKDNKLSIYIALIWCAYFLQTMLSPDMLLLTTTGFICAGVLIYDNDSRKTVKKS